MKTIILDNFLNKTHFDELQAKVMGRYFPWFYYDTIVTEAERGQIGNQFFNMHMLYDNDRPTFNTSFELMEPILNKLYERDDDYKLKSLVRVKINSYPNQNKFIEHSMHQDFPPSDLHTITYKSCLFCLNTCDGYTKLEDGTKIDSIANRAILFDTTKPHCSTNTTDQPRRVNINFNYF